MEESGIVSVGGPSTSKEGAILTCKASLGLEGAWMQSPPAAEGDMGMV